MVHSHIKEQQQLRQFLWGVSTSSYQVEGGNTNNDWSLSLALGAGLTISFSLKECA